MKTNFNQIIFGLFQAWDGNNISAFFVANRKTCLDWLARIRLMAAHLAFHLGEYAFALRQCQKAFENKASVPAVQQEDLLVDTVPDFCASWA